MSETNSQNGSTMILTSDTPNKVEVMTHWTKITPETTVFTDSSYQKLHTPIEYFWTTKQKEKMEEKRKKKEEDEKARRRRDMEESRRRKTL